MSSRSMPPLHLDGGSGFTSPAPPFQQLLANGAYAVGGVIGVGTYGEVRYAVSVSTGERVAIKIVDLARFSRETAGLMRKEISILRMLGNHPHCIRIIQVHENVPFAGKWCESCACTSFKRRAESANAEERGASGAAGGGASGAYPHQQPQHSHSHSKRVPLTASTPCAVCSHSASEHSGVNYHPDYASTTAAEEEQAEEDENDIGETRQVMLIVQELGSGGELFSLLSHSGPLPEDVARLYFQQLISGMEHLHSLGIAHRDLKPENLVLNEHFELKIADYGLASLGTPVHPNDPSNPHHSNSTLALSQQQQLLQQHHQHSHQHHSAAGRPDAAHAKAAAPEVRHYSGVGSMPYSAPEVYYIKELMGGRGYRGAPCDVWSAAVILFVMLVGRPPFVRPLAKTYGAHMRRCRHFVGILSGAGLDMLHPHAKDLLQKLLKLAPSERLTIPQMKLHPWMLGPVPSHEELVKIMNERSMLSWTHGGNQEMTHVLSKMRSSKMNLGELPSSNNGTPHFGAQSPSGSPSLDPHTALNSPSFSALASSVPPSPFASAHTYAYHSTQRAASPDSQQLHHRYSTVSPASFSQQQQQQQGQSAFLSPNAAHHAAGGAGGLSFLPPPNLGPAVHAARNSLSGNSVAAEASGAGDAVALPMPVTIASSINAAAPSVLRPHATPALLSVALLQMNIADALPPPPALPAPLSAPPSAATIVVDVQSVSAEAHNEIPPPLSLPPTPVSPVESKQNSKQEEEDQVLRKKKLAALAAQQAEAAQRQTALEQKKIKAAAAAAAAAASTGTTTAAARVVTPLKRSFTLTRHSTNSPPRSQPLPQAHSRGDGHGDDSPPLSLCSSHSHPPRVSYASFTCSLTYDALLNLLQSRLQQRGARFHAVPPRGKFKIAMEPKGTFVKMPSQQQQKQQQQQHSPKQQPSKSLSPQHSPRGGAGAAATPASTPSAHLSSATTSPIVETDEESLLHVVTSFRGCQIVALISIRTIRVPASATIDADVDSSAAAAAQPAAAAGAGGAAAILPRGGRLVLAEKIRAADSNAFNAWFESIAAGIRED